MKVIKHVQTKKGMTVNDLVNEMNESGVFQAGALAKATDICEKMISDKKCVVFLAQAGALIPGGMRGQLHDFLKNKWCGVFVTTGATLTHDLIEAIGEHHYQGSENADDRELQDKGINRMYDSFMKNDVYQPLEKFVNEAMKKVPEGEYGISDFLSEFGKHCPKDSILKTAYDNGIPVFCPALQDSGFGIMVFFYLQNHPNIKVSAFKDLKSIFDLAWTAEKKGYIYLGGGVPKNHVMQALQFAPKGADYGVQITTDVPVFGGSSGAPPREGISWHKLEKKASFVNVHCDATIALPIITAALKNRL